MADMKESSTLRSSNDLVDNSSTTVSTTHKQVVASVSSAQTYGALAWVSITQTDDQLTIPSDHTATTTYEDGPPAVTTNNAVAAPELSLHTKPTAAGADLSQDKIR